MLEFGKLNKLEPAKGRILISEPLLIDSFFHRKVVFLCEHTSSGSFGFILDKYIDMEMSDLLDDFPKIDSRISIGGPLLHESLYYIHTIGTKLPGSKEIANGIYFGGDFDILKSMIKSGHVTDEQLRFFVGYAGWEPKQLDEELKDHSWIVADADKKTIMATDNTDLWSSLLQGMGKEYAILATFPSDPTLN